MCAPLIPLAMAATAIGGGISAYSQIQAGAAQAAIANRNAELARANAASSLQAGAQKAGIIVQKGSQIAGAAKAAMAANGIDSSVGSAAAALDTTRDTAELDAMTTRNNAARAAWGYSIEADTNVAQASMARQRSILGAVGTGIGAIGSAASLGASMKAKTYAPTMEDFFG